LLNETILKCLPGAQNNPSQASLYKAFEAGDVEEIKKTPRSERMQLFITKLSAEYTEDINSSKFGAVQRTASSSQMKLPPPEEGPRRGRGSAPRSAPVRGAAGGPKAEGFVIEIEGYSPYSKIVSLLDPPGVAGDKERWGMITRMLNLESVCPNSPFKLFNKTKPEDFKLEFGEVEVGKPMPVGIGVEDSRSGADRIGQSGAKVLLDPLTREVISKQAQADARGVEKKDNYGKPIVRVNDYWFRVNAKFTLKKDAAQASNPNPPPGR
jgi:hypothetical protein